MKRFLNRIFLILILPILVFVLLIFLYVNLDPYQDFRTYENYSWKYFDQSLGDISVKKVIKNNFNYDSYIMGSSRSTGFYACYLQQKIKGSHFYHFGNWNESIGGIYEKIKLIDQHGKNIKNLVILIDTDYTFELDGQPKAHDHYLISKTSFFRYLDNHFRSFCSNTDNLKSLLGFHLENNNSPNWESDLITNDCNHNCLQFNKDLYGSKSIEQREKKRIDSLTKNTNFYFRKLKIKELNCQISQNEVEILRNIKSILKKHRTEYYILISPLYDQLKFNNSDIAIIREVFKERIYDFSGVNEFTKYPINFPDRKHFRDWIAKEIIDSITSPNVSHKTLTLK